MKNTRQFTVEDRFIGLISDAIETVFGNPKGSNRPMPGRDIQESDMEIDERRHSAGLMRVNHTGEVCAQALYQGQALTAHQPEVKLKMEQAAIEENDHLRWCESRLEALDSHKSLLNPLWYGSSFVIGAAAGAIGDKWSLGFVAETEHQVVRHLESHLEKMSPKDTKSRAVIQQMKLDEAQHAEQAIEAGAAELPLPIKSAMTLMAKVMTTTVYRI
ncbi:MAG: demethoxyubiquinone hydroxylase family protein [Kangiellaceae bacterium]|nr:demethoxyubiquinone hydroxylase family protein [Kangiellaceae bacterium]|tara:strand:- start:14931 stop:15578 length:648 start_codon:yes stop_codon:yes gene_type:complete